MLAAGSGDVRSLIVRSYATEHGEAVWDGDKGGDGAEGWDASSSDAGEGSMVGRNELASGARDDQLF